MRVFRKPSPEVEHIADTARFLRRADERDAARNRCELLSDARGRVGTRFVHEEPVERVSDDRTRSSRQPRGDCPRPIAVAEKEELVEERTGARPGTEPTCRL